VGGAPTAAPWMPCVRRVGGRGGTRVGVAIQSPRIESPVLSSYVFWFDPGCPRACRYVGLCEVGVARMEHVFFRADTWDHKLSCTSSPRELHVSLYRPRPHHWQQGVGGLGECAPPPSLTYQRELMRLRQQQPLCQAQCNNAWRLLAMLLPCPSHDAGASRHRPTATSSPATNTAADRANAVRVGVPQVGTQRRHPCQLPQALATRVHGLDTDQGGWKLP